MKKLVVILFLTAVAAFPQRVRTSLAPAPAASLTYTQIAPGCAAGLGLPEIISSSCYLPRIKVTAHPSNPSVTGFFVLVVYTSAWFNLPVVQPHFTSERDANGDFVCLFPSDDMSAITVSAAEVLPGSLIVAAAPTD